MNLIQVARCNISRLRCSLR